ncbi:Vacuolar protein sorting-associated protein vta1 [Boothiomyces macroporosus]|uniref:Vacuolar protein sorting-associated protein vta1 n=1 Tax=Boothiomyces macroporosus TaxID=261099 RepID=A0AAD5UGD5_9FUNG|nr:Vacuolar protein sorting-associated protein vta1 [Boothiomyces macroporosus]
MEPPPELKSVSTYLIRGKELEDKEPIVSYFCYLYATKLSISLGAKSKESQQFISSLMDKLEQDKVKLAEYEAINDDDVGYAHLENFGLKIFLNADNEDRNGLASKKTVKTFVAASVFLECLKIFKDGELDDDIKQKIKYAKYKAADIMKALNEGRKPNPGPPGSEIPSATQTSPVVIVPPPNLNEAGPSVPPVVPPKVVASAPVNYSTLQIPPEYAHLPVYQPPSTVPLPKDFSSVPDEDYELEDDYTEEERKVILEAGKLSKFAMSALLYDDVKTAVDNLEKALGMLKPLKQI